MNDYQAYEIWKQWDKASFGSWSTLDAAYYSAELMRCGIISIKGIRLYEVGFGNGAFAGYVQSLGCEYFGSELNTVLLERAKEFGLNVSNTGINEALANQLLTPVDAIVAFDILEHLDIVDIKSFLIDAYGILKPGGVILARVPSGDSPFGRAIFHGDITHRTALGSSAVRQLAMLTGFEVMNIGPPRLPILGIGWVRAMRRCALRMAQSVVSWLINQVFHDGQPRVITANLVFVLMKPAQGCD